MSASSLSTSISWITRSIFNNPSPSPSASVDNDFINYVNQIIINLLSSNKNGSIRECLSFKSLNEALNGHLIDFEIAQDKESAEKFIGRLTKTLHHHLHNISVIHQINQFPSHSNSLENDQEAIDLHWANESSESQSQDEDHHLTVNNNNHQVKKLNNVIRLMDLINEQFNNEASVYTADYIMNANIKSSPSNKYNSNNNDNDNDDPSTIKSNIKKVRFSLSESNSNEYKQNDDNKDFDDDDDDDEISDESNESFSDEERKENVHGARSGSGSGSGSLGFGEGQEESFDDNEIDYPSESKDSFNSSGSGCGSGCSICHRMMPLTSHHLIPVSTHKSILKRAKLNLKLKKHKFNGKNGAAEELLKGKKLLEELKKKLNGNRILICRPCHSAIHQIFKEEEMAKHYYTLERLLSNQEVLKWARFASKQRPSRNIQQGHTVNLKYSK